MAAESWEQMPTQWIANGELKKFKWNSPDKANFIASLMLYIVLVQRNEYGCTSLSYSQLCDMTNLSREKVAQGLRVLISYRLIEKDKDKRTNIYSINNYDVAPWGKLPFRKLYNNCNEIEAFKDFHLRRKSELNALKLYLLLVKFRDNKRNAAMIGYGKIHEYSGISINDIKSAISLLINNGLIHVESSISQVYNKQNMNIYRITHIDSKHHKGTQSKDPNEFDIDTIPDFLSDNV